jgi:hypothetical protein
LHNDRQIVSGYRRCYDIDQLVCHRRVLC